MKKLLIMAIFLVYGTTAFADSGISYVFVKNNEIIVSTESAEQIQLTHNRTSKNNPVWSKDGTMVAFLEEIDKKVALNHLVIISRNGKPLYNFLIHPVRPGWVESGMRYVERIEWLTNSRIAVSGSINPSTGENIIFDLDAHNISEEFHDDGGVAYSADGLHVAYITGAPHFTPKNGREPKLVVDEQRVFPPVGTKVDFITAPAWSADSQTLAIIATTLDTNISNIVIWHIGDKQPLLIPVPIKKEEKDRYIVTSLFWNDNGVYIVSDNQAWSFSQGRLSEISLSAAVNPKRDALRTRKGLETTLGVGAGQSDFWCQSCPLSLLPRRSPIYDTDPDVR